MTREQFRKALSLAGKPVLSAFLVWLVAISAHAQEIQPRSYAVIPKGLNVAALSYTYNNGSVLVDQSSPVQNLSVATSIIAAGYVSTFSLLKKLARLQVIVPYAMLSGTAEYQGRDTAGTRNGFGDARIKFGMNLVGSPVLSMKEFVQFQEASVLGASIVISAPIGQYYPTKLINLGSNRWGFKPEVGFSRRQGSWYLEFYSGIWLFTNNNQFLGSHTLSENPLFSFQAHASYQFRSHIWIAVNGGYNSGGQTKMDGKDNGNEQENLRLGFTFSMPLDKHQSVQILLNTGVETHAGQNYNAVTVNYQYSFF